MSDNDYMTIENGIITVADGTVTGINFVNCIIVLGPKTKLIGCTYDYSTEIEVKA